MIKKNILETNGDVTFFLNKNGKEMQLVKGVGEFKVLDSSIKYKHIKKIGQYDIKYQLNGCNGFTVFIGPNNILEDNFWTLDDAIKYVKSIS